MSTGFPLSSSMMWSMAVVGYGKPKGRVTPAGRPPLFGTGCRIRTGRQPVMEKETALHSALTPHCNSYNRKSLQNVMVSAEGSSTEIVAPIRLRTIVTFGRYSLEFATKDRLVKMHTSGHV